MQGEHFDAREARDIPSLLSPPLAAVTEGLSIVRIFGRSNRFLLFHNPSDLASLAHLPLHRGGNKLCLQSEPLTGNRQGLRFSARLRFPAIPGAVPRRFGEERAARLPLFRRVFHKIWCMLTASSTRYSKEVA